MEYGYFDDDRREYVVTRPDTPLPWINYLGTEDFFGMISNTAGGCSFYRATLHARTRQTRKTTSIGPTDDGDEIRALANEIAAYE